MRSIKVGDDASYEDTANMMKQIQIQMGIPNLSPQEYYFEGRKTYVLMWLDGPMFGLPSQGQSLNLADASIFLCQKND